MKTTFTALIAFLFICTTSGYAEKVKGNGNIISKEIQISDYTELNIRVKINYNNNSSLFKKKEYKGPAFNYMQKSGSSNLQITVDENLLPLLDIYVSDGCLYVRTNKEKQELYPTKFIINSSSHTLEKAKISGSMDFFLQNNLSGENLKVEVSGAADVYMNKPVRIANACEIKVSGAGDMEAKDLICGNIKAGVAGAGDLNLKGKAEKGEYKVSGSGDISAYGFIVKDLSCKVSGSGDIEAYATETLEASASGSGDICYKGNPKANTRCSGAADITRVK
ncbi:head GIN domain-containing protein [uncultured Parabacteroides sp.]|uniref:head GIN domain-containing protein n=1 Tax=uncultured Parabacteroides sp. TaxID=512312 RepID=UPI0028063AEF|nr:head GIN domain-containing protein [uncultured Parabacteroides sp.]